MLDRARELQLVLAAKQGDAQATAALIRALQDGLYGYLLRLCRRPELAEDLTQEALYRAVLHLDRYDPRWRLSTWVFTIARRLLGNTQQKRSPSFDTGTVEHIAAAAPIGSVWCLSGWTNDAPSGVEQREERSRQRSTIEAALAQLPDSQQEVVVLFHQLDWSIAQISELTGLPEGTIKSQLHRARAQLRQLLTELQDRAVPAFPGAARPNSGVIDCVSGSVLDHHMDRPVSAGPTEYRDHREKRGGEASPEPRSARRHRSRKEDAS